MSINDNNRLSIGGTTIFKLFLLVGIVVISLVFIWYTLDVISQLKQDAENTVTSYVRLWQLAASENTTGGEIQVIFEEVIKKANFPVVIAGPDGKPVFWRNVPGIVDNDPSEEAMRKVEIIAQKMKEDKGEIPLMFGGRTISYFYYGDSAVIRQLQWMPFVELGLVGAFILVGFIGFQNIRRSEERHIWVGMAKETAHQLGTPISSLMGWIEIGPTQDSDSSTAQNRNEIFDQMKVDVNRLQRVANRFGQIGSQPEWKEVDIDALLEETVAYFQRRLPFNGKGCDILYKKSNIPTVNINSELFTWVIENLIRNALQAVDPRAGRITINANLSRDNKFAVIDIEDNGGGIPKGIARKVFRPGFTTKKRGWGLGLTLSKRIIEEYHRGKISLVKSIPGQTIFRIALPIRAENNKNNVRNKV